MEILQIVGIGIIASVVIVMVKQTQVPHSAVLISMVVGVGIFLAMLPKITMVVGILQELSDRAGVNQFYLTTIFRIIGIAYITEFGAQVCRDAGEGAVAGRVEFAGKIIIMVLAIPIIAAILESLVRLLP
ncbi:MAG: stage III sporulation protein AD [Syntrophomonadaceae bacterium]|nr:stage III sporulation protein AD [Syntrophomonadaceae bacterium]